MTEEFDFLVVGSGEAGKYLAWKMAKSGARTALVERKLVGGSCPNVACLPSKNVVYSAKLSSLASRTSEFGLESCHVPLPMPAVFARKKRMVDGLIALHQQRFESTGVELVMGQARFTGERTVEVALNGGGTRVLQGKRLVLSLGSRSSFPPVPGLRESNPLTHIEALDLQRLPSHLVVLGGGYIGLEFAQAFRRLGAQVTVVARGTQLAPREDEDVSAALLELLRDEGVDVRLDAELTSVQGESGQHVELGVRKGNNTDTLQATDILVATGREPNTEGIGIEMLGVALDARGYVQVNERLETTAPEVWAVGDCAGSPQFTHAAYDDFRVVLENLRGGQRSTRDRLIPSCLFTDPELVRVGLNERELKQLGMSYRVAKLPAAAVLRTRTVSEPRGFLKAMIAADSDRILGFTAFCVEASELLAAMQTAISGNLPYTVVRDTIYTHPTMAEGLVFLLDQVGPVVH